MDLSASFLRRSGVAVIVLMVTMVGGIAQGNDSSNVSETYDISAGVRKVLKASSERRMFTHLKGIDTSVTLVTVRQDRPTYRSGQTATFTVTLATEFSGEPKLRWYLKANFPSADLANALTVTPTANPLVWQVVTGTLSPYTPSQLSLQLILEGKALAVEISEVISALSSKGSQMQGSMSKNCKISSCPETLSKLLSNQQLLASAIGVQIQNQLVVGSITRHIDVIP